MCRGRQPRKSGTTISRLCRPFPNSIGELPGPDIVLRDKAIQINSAKRKHAQNWSKLHNMLFGREVEMRKDTNQRYQAIVQRAEAIARAHKGDRLQIKFLCQASRVGERLLRNAFRSVHDNTPLRHLRELRMEEARKALLYPGSTGTTVTMVAMQFGFLELGRFSAEYRSIFGERPSATLRRSVSRLAYYMQA